MESELTPMQEGMIFHFLKNSQFYVQQYSWTIHGCLNIERFKSSWNSIIKRYSVLRTTFVSEDSGKIRQKVHDHIPFSVTFLDCTDLEKRENFENICDSDKIGSLDLVNGPLMKITLVAMAIDHYKLIWTHHHAILDGFSVEKVLRNFWEIYNGTSETSENFPFVSYVKSLRFLSNSESKEFWIKNLNGNEISLNFLILYT